MRFCRKRVQACPFIVVCREFVGKLLNFLRRHRFTTFQGDITVNDFHCNIFIKQTKMRKQYLGYWCQLSENGSELPQVFCAFGGIGKAITQGT